MLASPKPQPYSVLLLLLLLREVRQATAVFVRLQAFGNSAMNSAMLANEMDIQDVFPGVI